MPAEKGSFTLKNKGILWPLLAAVGALLIALAAFYWDALVMVAAPQIPLRQALGTAMTALEERYQESPVPILLRGYDHNGLNAAQVELSADGAVQGRLDVQADLEGNQIFLRGTLPEARQLGSLSLYLGREYAALTSDTLLQGGYYGITYRSFREDLLEIPLASFLVSEKRLSQWEDSVRALQEKMDWSLNLPQIPDISVDDLKTATLALWALRGRVTVEQLNVNGQLRSCWRVAYGLKGETAAFLWEKAMKTPMPQDGQIRFAFYLCEQSLVRLELEAGAEVPQMALALDLGLDAREDDLPVVLLQDGSTWNISLTSRQGRNTLLADGTAYCWDWNQATGALTLLLPGQEPLPMKLFPTDEGFRVESDHLWRLLRENSKKDYRCTLTITKGADVVSPSFKNLNQWSFDDLMLVLNGVWSLIWPQNK